MTFKVSGRVGNRCYSLKIELHSKNKQIFVTFSNPFDCNVVIVKLLKFFKETVKTVKTYVMSLTM